MNKLEDIVMFVNLYNNMFSIQIVEHGFPIFNMIEESEGGIEEYAMMVENYVERIANYYKFNLRKGKKVIGKVLAFNMNEDFSDSDLQELVIDRLSSFKAQLCSFNVEEKFSKLLPKACKLPYTVLLGEQYRSQHDIDFKLKRVSKKTVLGHQFMVFSMAIIVLILLVYIPYYALSEEQKMQQNRNNILQIQLDMLEEETPQPVVLPVDQMNYNTAYTYISSQKFVFTPYILNLLDSQTATVLVRSYRVETKLNQIQMVIQGTTEQELYEFVIDIYESYGVQEEPSSERWMIKRPTYSLSASFTMEVTITYA